MIKNIDINKVFKIWSDHKHSFYQNLINTIKFNK